MPKVLEMGIWHMARDAQWVDVMDELKTRLFYDGSGRTNHGYYVSCMRFYMGNCVSKIVERRYFRGSIATHVMYANAGPKLADEFDPFQELSPEDAMDWYASALGQYERECFRDTYIPIHYALMYFGDE